MSRLEGVVTGLFVENDPTSLVKRRVSEVEVTFEGFAGDKHVGLTREADSRTPRYPKGTLIRNTRQLSVVSKEELRDIAKRLKTKLKPFTHPINKLTPVASINPDQSEFFTKALKILKD